MSQLIDSWADVGPQSDGTFLPSDTSIIPQPADAAGGAPAQYGQQVLDLFKYGISAWSQSDARQQLFDYKKFEATNGGLYQQGAPATMARAATGGNSGLATFALIGLAAWLIMSRKA